MLCRLPWGNWAIQTLLSVLDWTSSLGSGGTYFRRPRFSLVTLRYRFNTPYITSHRKSHSFLSTYLLVQNYSRSVKRLRLGSIRKKWGSKHHIPFQPKTLNRLALFLWRTVHFNCVVVFTLNFIFEFGSPGVESGILNIWGQIHICSKKEAILNEILMYLQYLII